jgi:GNAT superfamily N-acetyltransferase
MLVRALPADEVTLIAAIDRSEHVDVEYAVVDGMLTERPVTVTEIPNWQQTGTGEHSVRALIDFCAPLLAGGAQLIGAFDDRQPVGVAVVDASFEPGMAWLAFLHVTRSHRRRGAATSLWSAAVQLASAAGAGSMYVSATPTGSAVGFYLRQGCRLAEPVHPRLFAHEPDDIHLVCPLR